MEDLVRRHRTTADSSGIVALHLFVRALQYPGNTLRDITALVPGTLQEAIVLRRGALASEPQPVDVGT